MAGLINATDSLNTGRFKINAIIEDASAAKKTADSVQTQLDTIILNSGTSGAEVVQSRVDKDGNPYQTLKSRLDSEKSIIDQSLVSLGSQLADKIGGGVKAEPEDLSAATLGLLTGTGGPINLLTIPQDNSVTKAKLSGNLKTEVNLLFPPDPNPNVMAPINNDPTTVSWFYDGGDAINVTYTEPIVNGIKKYRIDTTSAYTQLKKPYVALSGTTGITFDIAPNTTYEFKCDVEQSTAKGVFTFLIKNGTTTVDTQYGGFNAGETSELKTFTTPAGANKFEISLFGFNENISGEHHLTISNLSLKTVIPQDPNIITRTEALEATVGGIDDRVSNLENVPTKSYFILDFDYGPTSWADLTSVALKNKQTEFLDKNKKSFTMVGKMTYPRPL